MPFLSILVLTTALTLAGPRSAQPAVIEQRVKVDVTGCVRHPGLYALPVGDRVVDAIQAAGGPLPAAALDRVELADLLQDGESLQIPARQAASAPSHGARVAPRRARPRVTGRRGRSRPRSLASNAAPNGSQGGKIDLNSASADDLEQLPGVGPALASRILAYRKSHGRFHSIQELEEVRGIGDGRMAHIAPYVEAR